MVPVWFVGAKDFQELEEAQPLVQAVLPRRPGGAEVEGGESAAPLPYVLSRPLLGQRLLSKGSSGREGGSLPWGNSWGGGWKGSVAGQDGV